MEYDIFYKPESCGELGTTKASMNRTGKTNASAGPKKKYNEYKEFHNCEVAAHVCASFMEMTGMSNYKGNLVEIGFVQPYRFIMQLEIYPLNCIF